MNLNTLHGTRREPQAIVLPSVDVLGISVLNILGLVLILITAALVV